MRRIIFIGLISGFFLQANAQDFKKDFAAIVTKVEQSANCHIVSTITIYESKKSKQKLTSFGAELKKNETDYRSKMEEVEMISNKDFMIMIDYEEKIVQIEKVQKISKSDREFLKDFYAVDSMANGKDSVVFVSKTGNLSTYKINFKKGMIVDLLIVINTVENTIQRLEYEYNKTYFPSNNYIVIDYSVFSFNSSFDKSLFEGSDVVTRKGNDFFLKEKYKSFELLNLYNEVR